MTAHSSTYQQAKSNEFLETLKEVVSVRVLVVFLLCSGLLGAVGWRTYTTIKQSVQERLEDSLSSTLEAEVQKIELWYEGKRAAASRIASSGDVERAVIELVKLHRFVRSNRGALLQSDELYRVRELLGPIVARHRFSEFLITTESGFVIGALESPLVGTRLNTDVASSLGPTFKGKTVIGRPRLRERKRGGRKEKLTSILISAPIRGDSSTPIASLSLEYVPHLVFPDILASGVSDNAAQTQIYDRKGQIISVPPLPSGPQSHLTPEMLSEADGANLNGYHGVNGKRVVGAWMWLSRYHVGLIAELERSSAYQPLGILLKAFGFLFSLLVVTTVAIMLVSFTLIVFRRKAQAALLEAKHLGQYRLEERIGRGGMGEVFRGRHLTLRRPTAIKLIRSDRVTEKTLNQFEREVQLTSRLTHPNTIAVYDYGRTPDNIFYYAMEFLTGFTLKQLVMLDGPQTEARLIYILQQICASLEEAHGIGVIHRDIKPANIMLCHLGGMYDVVKVLDFGLVKDISRVGAQEDQFFAGSLRFLAPEAVSFPDLVDHRSDIYSLGSLAFYVLTGGEYVYQAKSSIEYHTMLLSEKPSRPSDHLGRKVSSDFEKLIMSCLSRNPDDRPPDVRAVSDILQSCKDAGRWTKEEGREWWELNREELKKIIGLKDPDELEDESGHSIFIDLAKRR